MSEQLIDELFSNSATFDREMLERGIGHRSPLVRRKVVSLLTQRSELSVATAMELSKDSDAFVRFYAVQAAIKAGRTFTDVEAQAILIKPSLGAAKTFSYDQEGQKNWDSYRRLRYSNMSELELERLADAEGIYNLHAHYALHDLKFKNRAAALRAMIDDGYANFFDKKLATLAAMPGISAETVGKTRELSGHICKGYMSESFEIICKKALPEDLGRIRKALQSELDTHSDAVVKYMGLHGEWRDIELIITSVERPNYQSVLSLAVDIDKRYRNAARAILSIAQDRLAQLLSLSMSPNLLAHVIAHSTDNAFRRLSSAMILPLLLSEDDRVRKSAALKSVRALPKKRVRALLDGYVSGDKKRYYNVVHWLDFGVSVPKERVLNAVRLTINQEWLHKSK